MSNAYGVVNEVEMTRGEILEMTVSDTVVCAFDLRVNNRVETVFYRDHFDSYDKATSYDVLIQAFNDRNNYLTNRYKASDEERLRYLCDSLENLFGDDVEMIAEFFETKWDTLG